MTGRDRLIGSGLIGSGSAHDCPGCGRQILLGQFACRDCWRTLPPLVRRAVNGAWRRIIKAEGDPDAHQQALAGYRRATSEATLLLTSGGLFDESRTTTET